MNPDASWEEIERLYNEALELPDDEREALLARACPTVRQEVESLLEADSTQALLAAPPVHLAADLLNRQPGGLLKGQRVAGYEVESLISMGLRRSREMTILCSPKVTQHHQAAGAAFAARQESIMPVWKREWAARVTDRAFHHSAMSATDQGSGDAARAGLLPR